ncbi:hypothetical protein RclHR1_13730004 [Rhizophagus clarus]|uniref:Uncharacterized protein n=1 Tax=Rhizophagus clarus TaxID=94130 RepID=A0A2Z6QQP8_9GLOM|nr:hypothetical protein RclHR1_13730004 [Rhizophagus clarus]
MLIDPPDHSNLSVAPDAHYRENLLMQSLTPLLPDFVPTRSILAPIHTQSSPVTASNASSSSLTLATIPSPKILSMKYKLSTKSTRPLKVKWICSLPLLACFISSINTSSSSNSAALAGSK